MASHGPDQTPDYRVDEQNVDSLGDPRWDKLFEFNAGTSDREQREKCQLAEAVKSLVLREEPLDAACKLGGWDAVHAILRKRDGHA